MKKNYRRCVSCRHVASKEYFWRIVRTYPDRKIQLDRGMGRSAYLCPQIDCLVKAKQKKRLQKTLKTAVSEQIYQVLENRLITQPK
ncbi:Nucleic acid-binding protein [Hyella patelloides LEGE 07179]|uniref:Nucleic acid-binding protein n=1 Tax=Hyella patelloides LEGE 07179 TaxID=945734 RepID=A0A563VPU7_9CYAN|nr:YlxR family protein [Hyella patelloides]VEP13492.1 Nucleic acid-binding protein [Hyella patelloides LEGE 07179]